MSFVQFNQVMSKAALTLCLSMTAYAGNTHTWHQISAKSGQWNGTLSSISEHATFVTSNGAAFNHFMLTTASPVTYGFQFADGDDFDVAYTLTLTEKSEFAFASKACVFVITALRPAVPDIRALSYHGATCDITQGNGQGVNFEVA